jgi:hypothetical protein
MRRHITLTRGISLIEMVIYAAILMALVGASITTILSLRTVFEKTRVERVMTGAAVTSLERLTRDIRDADQVNTSLSILNATSSVLVLENGATTTTYSVSNGQLLLNVEGVSKGFLTPDDTRVINFIATQYMSGQTQMVRVTLDLKVTNRFASTTDRFSTAAVLRGSYEE